VDRRLPEADAVLGFAVTRDNFARASRLKWVHVTAAGVGPLLFPAMVESDVLLSNSRGLHGASMAEHTIGVMLSFVRNLHLSRDAQARRQWVQLDFARGNPAIGQLAGRTLGLVGLGAVGSATATRAKALGMRVIAVRKHPATPAAPADEQWPASRLDDLLAASDFVVLAAPLTGETRGLIDAARLARMKPGALLVNLGRGSLVDEPALIAALERGAIGGGARCHAREPLPAGSPLWAMPQ
jgi:phosphoglycerate dehydrogenase-like enzyme